MIKNTSDNTALSSAPVSLSELLRAAGGESPDKTAIRLGENLTTFADLEASAAAISNLGIAAGERIAVRIGPKDQLIKTLMGIIRSGAIAVPLDRDEPQQQKSLLLDCGAARVIHDGTLTTATGEFPNVDFLDVADLGSVVAVSPPTLEPECACLMLYTSGTLGRRKGVVLSQANLAATVKYMTGFMKLDNSIVEYVGSPVDHAFGFGRCRAVIANGGTLVLDDAPFSPVRALALIAREGCNSIAMAATGMAMLVEHFGKQLARLADQILWVEVGSVPMRTELMDRLVDLLPNARIVMNYGMSEAQRSTMIDFRAERVHLGAVGRPSPGCAVRTRNDAGEVIWNEPGIVEVAGPHVATGYWNRDDLWQERLSDGWFETDDLGIVDDSGYLTFIGRRDDMINIGGDKISPVEIEHLIEAALGDISFCICAATDPEGLYGEIPVLCIETGDPERTVKEFGWKKRRRQLSSKIPNVMVPQRAVAIEKFPRTGNGKIQRRLLRQDIEGGLCADL